MPSGDLNESVAHDYADTESSLFMGRRRQSGAVPDMDYELITQARARRVGAETLSVLALLAVAVTSSIRQEDIRFWDESSYLERGQTLGFGLQPGWEWNPLYTDIYWLISKFAPDPIDTYFAGRALSASLLVIAVWFSLRLFTRPKVALAGGLVMAALPITYVWPGVSNPSTAFLIAALAVIWRWRTLTGAASAMVLVWAAAATRPEFVWAAIAGTLLAAMALVREGMAKRISLRQGALLVLVLVAAPTFFSVGYGSPLQMGSRSWDAFGQHYELRFATSSDDPWDISTDIVSRDFPTSTSIPSAAMENPTAMVRHVTRNAATLVLSTGGHYLGLGGANRSQNVIGVAVALVWLVSLVATTVRPKQSVSLLMGRSLALLRARQARLALLLTLLVAGVSLISLLVIYPRPHYLGLIVTGLLVATGVFIDRMGRPALLQWLPFKTIAGFSAVALAFNVWSIAEGSNGQVNAESLRTMNSMDANWRLLTPDRPIDLYLENGTHILAPDVEVASFTELLEANEINAIFDGILFRQASWNSFEDFPTFLEDPARFGFEPVVEGSPFLIRLGEAPETQ